MPKNPPQKLNVPSAPKVAHRKGVAKGMGREANTGDSKLLSQFVEVPFKVPTINKLNDAGIKMQAVETVARHEQAELGRAARSAHGESGQDSARNG